MTFDFENGEQVVALPCPLPLELVHLRVLTRLSVSLPTPLPVRVVGWRAAVLPLLLTLSCSAASSAPFAR